jgi:hypothetical protein
MTFHGDIRIQGLHVARVLAAAKALVATLSRHGGSRKLGVSFIHSELSELEDAVNRLAQFEREAKSRGTLKHTTDAAALARALDAARGLLDASPTQRDILRMSTAEVAEAFSLDGPDAGDHVTPDSGSLQDQENTNGTSGTHADSAHDPCDPFELP